MDLLQQDVVTRNGNISKMGQDYSPYGSIHIQLTVNYSKPVINGETMLHLCTASGSWWRDGAIEGVSPTRAHFICRGNGHKYVNGVFAGTSEIGINKDISSISFSNMQLMPENTAYTDFVEGSCGLDYSVYCTRGVDLFVNIPFNVW